MSFKWDRAFSGMLTSLVAVLGLSANLHAASNDKQQSKEKPGPFAFVFPKDMNLTNPIDFYASAQLLVFQAQEDGLDFVINNEGGTGTDLIDAETVGFSGKNYNWDYSVGTRVNAGFYFNHDAWNIDATWSWLNSPTRESTSGSLATTWLDDDAESRNDATGKWQSTYHAVDVHLAKPYYVSRNLIFNPHFGLRFGWINQDFSIHMNDVPFSGGDFTIFHGKNDFWGVGTRVGIDTTWLLGCEWKLFCNVAASILSGQFKTSQKIDYPADSDSSTSFSNNFHMNVPNLDIAVGFDWGTYLCNKKYYLDFAAGYEFQVWWDQFNLRRFDTSNATQGNFTLNGFTFKVQLDM